MKLADLNPRLAGSVDNGILTFDCPLGHGHKIRVAIHAGPHGEVGGERRWQATGEFPDSLSLTPSVDAGPACWHGHVTNGAIT